MVWLVLVSLRRLSRKFLPRLRDTCAKSFGYMSMASRNDDVLLRADIDPLDLLATGAQRLQRSVQQDDSRSNGLKLREQLRISFIVDQVNALRAQPKGLSILAVRKAEICVVECPECGLSFGTREGLAQHLRLRHPELANLARIPFDRAVHSLHGIPVCRFCHVRLHDWSSLSKHLSGGNCGWVKDQVARGRLPTELLAIIAEREALDPPQPPHELLEMQIHTAGARATSPTS